jgi:hypothetical protein
MSENKNLDLGKAFAREGAKRRFRKLVGVNDITEEEVEEMVAGNDGRPKGSGRTLCWGVTKNARKASIWGGRRGQAVPCVGV